MESRKPDLDYDYARLHSSLETVVNAIHIEEYLQLDQEVIEDIRSIHALLRACEQTKTHRR